MDELYDSLKAAAGEFVYPARSLTTIMAILVFVILLQLALRAGVFGIWLAIILLPSLVRNLVVYLEARARDREPETAGIENFSWIGNYWSLFPIVPLAATAVALVRLADSGSSVGFWLLAAAAIALLPASLIVLAITHSPLQSVNPAALRMLFARVGIAYVVAPLFLAMLLCAWVILPPAPGSLAAVVALYVSYVAFGICGAVVRSTSIVDDVDIEVDETAGAERRRQNDLGAREKILSHAYGFASRGNISGALKLIESAVADDRAPDQAPEWYFTEMLKWEDPFAALKLAQGIVHDKLEAGDPKGAVKLILRGRLIDSAFVPRSEDLPAAIEAAEVCNNPELARTLRNA